MNHHVLTVAVCGTTAGVAIANGHYWVAAGFLVLGVISFAVNTQQSRRS